MGHQDAAARIRALAGNRPPRVGLILGSGLGGSRSRSNHSVTSVIQIFRGSLSLPSPVTKAGSGLGLGQGCRLHVFRVDFIFTKDMIFSNWPCRFGHFGRPVATR